MTALFTQVGWLDVADLAVRATVILLVAFALQCLVRGGASATRHHLWTLTFALLLTLPVVRLAASSWEKPRLPRAADSRAQPRLGELEREVPASFVLPATGLESSVSDVPPVGGSGEALRRERFVLALLLVWGVGCGAALVSLGLGALRFRRLVRGGETVQHEAWLRQLKAIRQQLAIRTDVRLVLGPEGVVPMTGGIRRPVILLPVTALSWSEARRRVVLAHELVHVRRRDVLRQVVSRTVLAIYWFHPLCWAASRTAAARREEACDEEVLATGARPSEYAEHLLSLARDSAAAGSALSVAMAQCSRLERRIRAILEPPRARPQGVAPALGMTAVLAVAGVFATLASPFSAGPLEDPAALPQVDCTLVSGRDRPSEELIVPVSGGPFDCTIQGVSVTGSGGSQERMLDLDGRFALGIEVWNQIERHGVRPVVKSR